MRISSGGIKHVTGSEGLRLRAYLDDVGIPTIGYGHTGKDITEKDVRDGKTISETQAEELFRQDIAKFEDAVNKNVTVPLTQNQYDALVSFSYNVGTTSFVNSTLLKKLNAGDMEGAAAEFEKWTKAKGKTLPGLVARRQREKEIFLGLRKPEDLAAPVRVAANDPNDVVVPGSPMNISTPTDPDQIMAENQRIKGELQALTQSLGKDAENLTENENFLGALRREGRGTA